MNGIFKIERKEWREIMSKEKQEFWNSDDIIDGMYEQAMQHIIRCLKKRGNVSYTIEWRGLGNNGQRVTLLVGGKSAYLSFYFNARKMTATAYAKNEMHEVLFWNYTKARSGIQIPILRRETYVLRTGTFVQDFAGPIDVVKRLIDVTFDIADCAGFQCEYDDASADEATARIKEIYDFAVASDFHYGAKKKSDL